MFAFYQVLFGQKMHNSIPATGHFTDPLTFPEILYTLKKSRVQTSVKPGQIIQNFKGRFYKKEYGTESLSERAFAGSGRRRLFRPDYWIWCWLRRTGGRRSLSHVCVPLAERSRLWCKLAINCEIVRLPAKIRKVPIPFRRSCSDAGDALFLTA